MKKIKISGLVFLISVAATSCKDINFSPLFSPSTSTWNQNTEQYEMSVNDVFRIVFWPSADDIWSDDYMKRFELSMVAGGTINSESSDVVTLWDNAYKAIIRANIVLKDLETAADYGISQERIDLYRGLMLFVRAGQFGILTTYFGDVVYYEDVLKLDDAWTIGRTSRSDIMENVYRDFDLAAELLPKEPYGSDAYRATKGAAYAMKARFALYNQDWEIAADAASKCMALNVYELHPDFSEYFLNSTTKSKESIFFFPRAIEYSITLSPGPRNYLPRTRNGYAWYSPTWDLFCSYYCTDGLPIDESPLFDPRNPFKNRDPRCAATIVEFNSIHVGVEYDPNPYRELVPSQLTGANVPNTDSKSKSEYASYNGLLRKKGVDESWVNDAWRADPDYIIMRYADVLLIYAEAKIEADDIDQSTLDAINKVRARAYGVDYTKTTDYPAVTTTNRDQLRKIVRTERRMEFAFEGHRYLDLVRWNIAHIALNKPGYGLLDLADLKSKVVDRGLWFFPETPQLDENGIADFEPMYNKGLIKLITQRQFDADRQYLFPIPAEEVVSNPNLGQNDNY